MSKYSLSSRVLIFCLAGAALAFSEHRLQAQVNVDIYSGFSASGGGAPYSGLVGSFGSTDVMFATNTGFNWHPFGLADFGADITGFLSVAADGDYGFGLNSDDGSLLFIDGNLVVDNGNAHGPNSAFNTATLSAGTHPFEVQFFECCGGQSGVDLSLGAGVSYAPEPASLTILVAGLLCPLVARRRPRSAPRC